MKKHIPNLITSMNVISGTLAIFMVMYGHIRLAAGLVVLAMIFDFFDGLAARLLHVKSEIGKELDSLADMVSFGVAPAMMAHFLLKMAILGGGSASLQELTAGQTILVFLPLIIPAFSAYRLAKFNLDPRQSTSFIGVPTPANALFWLGLVYGSFYTPEMYTLLFGNTWVLLSCTVILSVLLISEVPMFSLKISGFAWQQNKMQYIFFICLVALGLVLGRTTVMFIIPLYVLFNLLELGIKRITNPDH